MATMYYDDSADLGLIQGRKVAIIGCGSQGHAHALNLKDSGVDVRVGLYAGSRSRAKAERHGLRVVEVPEAVREADIVTVLTPDVGQARLYRECIEPHLRTGMMLMFAHGFSIHFNQIQPPAAPGSAEWPTPRHSAPDAQASSRPLSRTRPRRTSSASRRCSAAESAPS